MAQVPEGTMANEIKPIRLPSEELTLHHSPTACDARDDGHYHSHPHVTKLSSNGIGYI
ncbi:hypothetical protein JOE11_002636 [Robbsia andropogonis]